MDLYQNPEFQEDHEIMKRKKNKTKTTVPPVFFVVVCLFFVLVGKNKFLQSS